MRFDILTIFPEIFSGFLKESFIKKAQEKKLIQIKIYNLRDFSPSKHKKVDDKPYGGGLGMVLKIEPVFSAIKFLTKFKIENKKLKPISKREKIIVFTPRGRKFNQALAYRLSKLKRLILICGRYEGIDERVLKYISSLNLSIGDYDLMGGEVAAMVVIETICRLIPGVIGKEKFLKERMKEKGFLEFAQYTRPAIFSPKKGVYWKVPKVLLSGNHRKIEEWRRKHQKLIEGE